MDAPTRDRLASFLRDVRNLPNEAAKTSRFMALIGELYPGTRAVTKLADGIEKAVRIDLGDRAKRGRIDAYYGNAIIEFEDSLKATERVALGQLKEYAAGTWAKEAAPYRPLLCVASDGVVWKTFRPRLADGVRGKPKPSDVELEPLASFTLTDASLKHFWVWLTSLLFRPGQTLPTVEQFRMDFGAGSLAFGSALDALRDAWKAVADDSEPRLAFETWSRYLTVTYGEFAAGKTPKAEQLELFFKHTYLASVAKLLIWASLSGGKSDGDLGEVARDVLSGEYFRKQGIENLVEDDFFQWVRRKKAWDLLVDVWARILVQLQGYDLSRLSQDVLKGIYQELVDPKDRHDLGEYYTPEWLCERVVEELLPRRGFVSVLDPTCGSGSFLRAVIAHQLRVNPDGGDVTRLRAILSNVMGIDIHPLAVTIARATYVLAVRSLLKNLKRPVQIPVYLADSLFLPEEVRQLLLGEKPGFAIRVGRGKGQSVSMAAELVNSPDLFDPAIDACAKVAVDHAETGGEDARSFRKYLGRAVPDLLYHPRTDDMVGSLWKFTEELARLIKRRENSIWAFIVKNTYRPAMLRDRFAFIVGNPPWLSYRYIADPEYQAEVKRRAVDEYGIAPDAQKLMTQMELATVFLAHTLVTFGRAGARLAFVMPRSVLSADQHDQLRVRGYRAAFSVDSYWDLFDVRPVFEVPSCVLFASKTAEAPRRAQSYTLPARIWSGTLDERDASWEHAQSALTDTDQTARLIFLGSRSALSTERGAREPGKASAYAPRFHQGATLVPRSCYFVSVDGLDGRRDLDRLYYAETDAEQAAEAKAPYKDVKLKGRVEGRFLYGTALSRHLYPFALLSPAPVFLPALPAGTGLRMIESDEMRKEGYREAAKWMAEVERIWARKRAEKADEETVYSWLDYQGKLTSQDLAAPFLVLYNAAGTNVSAAAVARKDLSLPFVVEHKLYWCACESQDEADYLAAILNSEAVNEAIKPFQSMGLLGERDIEKKVLEIPIPIYAKGNKDHRAIAALGARARAEAARHVASAPKTRSLAKNRGAVREALAEVLAQINEACGALLGVRSSGWS